MPKTIGQIILATFIALVIALIIGILGSFYIVFGALLIIFSIAIAIYGKIKNLKFQGWVYLIITTISILGLLFIVYNLNDLNRVYIDTIYLEKNGNYFSGKFMVPNDVLDNNSNYTIDLAITGYDLNIHDNSEWKFEVKYPSGNYIKTFTTSEPIIRAMLLDLMASQYYSQGGEGVTGERIKSGFDFSPANGEYEFKVYPGKSYNQILSVEIKLYKYRKNIF